MLAVSRIPSHLVTEERTKLMDNEGDSRSKRHGLTTCLRRDPSGNTRADEAEPAGQCPESPSAPKATRRAASNPVSRSVAVRCSPVSR